ncbi:DUF397 domain-containing protein [Actinomadura craniellae]|uniref:DUF397 domain-containing protein n=1 Tax=Actinomadura craniellae TaxID=2231787 RepID=A0A365GY16_9ACTN|nr:DUF397 domain-containing protein [Actinomadura craniellae]RAY11711.1 DUF397 domain-containing protein [Actinomadura craniellae]
MAHRDTSRTAWRKSSYSGQNGNCVEIADLNENTIGVRDSTNPAAGHLTLSAGGFAALLARVKRDELTP